MSLRQHLRGLPKDLSEALANTYQQVVDHYLLEEWDDAQVDAGHFSEAVLRYLQFKMGKPVTPIDGKSKPNRKKVVNEARQDAALPPSLRAQIPQSVELVMDFRNSRSAAHLGDIDPNKLDATCVMQCVSWLIAEIVRVETDRDPTTVQGLIDDLAERQIPTIQTIDGRPIILNRPDLSPGERALVLLLHQGRETPVPIAQLREWVGYGHSTRWRNKILSDLEDLTEVHVDADGLVHLLRPGEKRAEQLVLRR